MTRTEKIKARLRQRRSPAWDGAGDGEAEREWQTDQLRRYLDGEIES